MPYGRSNLKGHEIRFAYAFAKSLDTHARLYLGELFTTVEAGNPFRMDFNYSF